MSIEERIEKYYLDRLKKYEDEIGRAIEALLGPEIKKLYDSKKEGFRPVFIASRDGVEYYLGNTPTKEEKEILEYLLDEMELTGRDFVTINSYSNDELGDEKYSQFIDTAQQRYVYYSPRSNIHRYYYKIDIFELKRNGYDLDNEYFFRLLDFLVFGYFDLAKSQWVCRYKFINIDFNIENATKEIYVHVISTLSLQLVSLLRQKGIYLLDEEDDYNLKSAIGRYKMVNPKFISAFQRLMPMFLLEPHKFIDIVGADNFRDFIICTLDKNSGLDIDDIINRMIVERDKKARYEMISINLPLMAKAKRKIDEDKARALELEHLKREMEARQSVSDHIAKVTGGSCRYSGISSSVDSLESRGLVNNNILHIDNKENLQKKDADWKYGKKSRH